MKTKLPPSGMRDFLPGEKAIREEVIGMIRQVYAGFGFEEIETSVLENIENLVGDDGGENTKLIYQVLKRGEKLDLKGAKTALDVVDLGLRFDLTLPLVRFYSNNRNALPTIFKALQVGTVFRAERPQKGRFRAFTQCDVDIIGDPSNFAEIEVISTVSDALKSLGLRHFKVKINDRRIIKAIVKEAGFPDSAFVDIAITMDKEDKVGDQGVLDELLQKGYDLDLVKSFLQKTRQVQEKGLEAIRPICPEAYDNLSEIIGVVEALREGYTIEFDYSLVRGMGYYTGTIFEVAYGDLGYSIAGGGRYDDMIKAFSGNDIPAIGFSIGFERIMGLVLEERLKTSKPRKLALIFDGEVPEGVVGAMMRASELRREGKVVALYKKKNKLGKQIKKLEEDGYEVTVLT